MPHLVFHAVIYDLSVGRFVYDGDVDHEILKTYKIFIIKYLCVCLSLYEMMAWLHDTTCNLAKNVLR